MRRNQISFILLLVTLACQDIKATNEISISDDEKFVKQFTRIENKKFEVLFEYNYGTPYKFIDTDSILYLFDGKGGEGNIVHLYDYSQGIVSNKIVEKGNGLHQSFSPVSFSLKNNTISVYEFSMRKMIEVNLDSIRTNNMLKEIKLPSFFDEIEILDDYHYIGHGYPESNNKYQILNRSNGDIVEEFGKFLNIHENLKNEVLKQFFQFTSATHSKLPLVASAYRWHDQIEIHNLKSKKSFSIVGPSNINNHFALTDEQTGEYLFNRGGEIQHCFMSISATENYIYGLFSGKRDDEDNAYFARNVFVYDWEGNPIKHIILDREVSDISVSPSDKMIFSFDIDTGEVIYIDL